MQLQRLGNPVILKQVINLFVVNLKERTVNVAVLRKLLEQAEDGAGNDARAVVVVLNVLNHCGLVAQAHLKGILPIRPEHRMRLPYARNLAYHCPSGRKQEQFHCTP